MQQISHGWLAMDGLSYITVKDLQPPYSSNTLIKRSGIFIDKKENGDEYE